MSMAGSFWLGPLARLALSALAPLAVGHPTAAAIPANVAGHPRLITLGTMGGPLPHAARSQPANVLVNGNNVYLVDAGDGAAEQLAKAGIALGDVDGVFLSHLHADHVSGLGALLMLRIAGLTSAPIDVYGPPGTRRIVDGIIESMRPVLDTGYGQAGVTLPDPGAAIRVTEISSGWQAKVGTMSVRAVGNTHFGAGAIAQSLAFRFDIDRASIVYTGDTGPSAAVEALAGGADIMFAEMIDIDLTLARIGRLSPGLAGPQLAGIARHLASQHLTPEQVGELAQRAEVVRLVVTHLVHGGVDEDRLASYLQRIGTRFHGPAQIAADLDVFEVE